ncbi:ABC transporter permease [Prauserella marina]|uniref:Peptide/nickel transport system permease protein n=1 Tax=Prauserella marina TaxID=530584 RepID=A0A222VNU8_9PSEU|nr:ABC transporter permease [Prauserella marina]ASR35590.1 ABC transporter permease [Prauserella marina]PWV84555.1 peptide/nickel transport system permease protein [Prauserella marina]SDC19315.1 peptide/nickel transport system permease protein [Prauserella marina]
MTLWRNADWLTRSGLVCLAVLVLASLVGTVFGVGGDPDAIVGPRLLPPGGDYPLGTDELGRSLLPRLFEGIGTTLLLSGLAVLVTAVLATLLGVAAGYRGGWLGEVVMRLVEVLYSFPTIVLAILVAAVIGPGLTATMCSIILITIPLMTRVVRAAAVTVAQRDYVTSAVISGAGWPRILMRHLLPNLSGTIAVQGTYALSVGILVEGGLSFLGFGVQPPQSSLGALIQQGSTYLLTAPWLVVVPGVVLVVAILAVNTFGDGLRDGLEPREARSLV